MKKTLIVVGVIAVILIILLLGFYNTLVTKNEAINGQWAQVETQYQRRYDLIPNLVESVKGVMKQEQAIFDNLTEARTRYSGAVNTNDKVRAANELEVGLGRLIAIMENYPELKSAENVQTLMVQLEGTENRISVERKKYNDVVKEFNVLIKTFPTSMFGKVFGFSAKSYFEADSGAEIAPKVEF